MTNEIKASDISAIERSIHVVRGQKVMLDRDLAGLYGVLPKRLNEQVRRNLRRFPSDFMFQLTPDEHRSLRSQIATIATSRGAHSKYPPLAFTEHGVTMLSSVLRSERAIEVNIQVVRVFVRLRQLLVNHHDLARRLDDLERKYDGQFAVVFEAIRRLTVVPEPPRRKIGFRIPDGGDRSATG